MIEQGAHWPGQDKVSEKVLQVEAPARPEHTGDLTERLAPVGNVMDDAIVHHGIETGIRRGDRSCIADEDVRAATILRQALPREGPTGPSKKQVREALRRAFIGLSVVATAALVLIALAFSATPEEPPAPAPLPVEQRPGTSVAIVEPVKKPEIDTTSSLDIEPKRPVNVVTPAPDAPEPPKPEPYSMKSARATG